MTIHSRPWLEQIQPYRPGRRATSADGSMASNESPIGTSPQVATALAAAATDIHRYPDPMADSLRRELAHLHHVEPDQILIGNGSDELILLLATAFLAQGGHAVAADPAYRVDEISTQVVNARMTKVALKDWVHDLDTMAEVKADIAYIVNPHNPTGTTVKLADIKHFAATCRADLVVVDEAYIDFTDDPDTTTAMTLVNTGNVAVIRTFSKSHGLAGLRIGYLVASPSVIATLRKIRAPFSVGTLAQAGAIAALSDSAYRSRIRGHTIQYRERVTRLLERAGYTVVPSQANFVLVVADEDAFTARLASYGITVRPGQALGIAGTVRVSVPSEKGFELLQAALCISPMEQD